MTEVKWGDPPPEGASKGRKSKYLETAEALRQRPGEWALIHENASRATATQINRGASAWKPAGAFEAVGRHVPGAPNHRVDIYVRYVGNETKEK